MNYIFSVIFQIVIIVCCAGQANINLSENIHYVIIETDTSEVNKLQKTLQSFRPNGIELPKPENMDISKDYPTKAAFWLKTGKNKPLVYKQYISPQDTIGKEVTFIPSRDFKLPKSGLSALVNGFGKHYCIVVRQFINQKEADEYIQILIQNQVISNQSIAFPIAIDNYSSENLIYIFDNYIQAN